MSLGILFHFLCAQLVSDINISIIRSLRVVSVLQAASPCNTDTTPNQPHRNSNTHRTKNNTTNVVIQQNSRKLLMMDMLKSETYWAHKKWNKMASDIKLVFYSSTITMMHGPINIRLTVCVVVVCCCLIVTQLYVEFCAIFLWMMLILCHSVLSALSLTGAINFHLMLVIFLIEWR